MSSDSLTQEEYDAKYGTPGTAQFENPLTYDVSDLTDSGKIALILTTVTQTAEDIAAIRGMLADAMTQVGPFLAGLQGNPMLKMLGLKL